MKLYISQHAEERIKRRIPLNRFIDSLYEIFFHSNYGVCVEVIENKKSNDFTKIKNPHNHKIRVGNDILIFSQKMNVLLTVNPCELSKLKTRRSQSFIREVEELKNVINSV